MSHGLQGDYLPDWGSPEKIKILHHADCECRECQDKYYKVNRGLIMDKKIRAIEKKIKKDTKGEEKQLKSLEKMDKKQDKIVEKAKAKKMKGKC